MASSRINVPLRKDINSRSCLLVHQSYINSHTYYEAGRKLLAGRCWSSLRRRLTTSAVMNGNVQMSGKPNHRKSLTLDTLNPHIKTMEYAVRGPLVIRAIEIEKELEKGVSKPFTEVIRANIGDCHAKGQRPITFIREVLALLSYPPLMDDPRFACDVKEKAKEILASCKGGSVGSYTESPGIEMIRRHAAQYIERRDGGIPSNWENIFLCTGASGGIKSVIRWLIADIDGKQPGVMIPIPQYPLYSALLAEFNIYQVEYYLDECNNWALNLDELQRSINECRQHCYPRAIVAINPGNPTGQVFTRSNIEEMIKFAHNEQLFILSDEVYQDNVYGPGSKFFSFKKVLMEMGPPYDHVELASFMSCSKGYMGECGVRSGYCELVNIDPEVISVNLKSISAKLCPPVLGQSVMECVVNPPQVGDPSYAKFEEEKTAVLCSLTERAKLVVDTFNDITGMSCNTVQGAMYAFPQIQLPEKAIAVAKKNGIAPDSFYAFRLLEETGVCVVPGNGFGQQSGTYHFRTTILPLEEKLKNMLSKFREFHEKFMKQYK